MTAPVLSVPAPQIRLDSQGRPNLW